MLELIDKPWIPRSTERGMTDQRDEGLAVPQVESAAFVLPIAGSGDREAAGDVAGQGV